MRAILIFWLGLLYAPFLMAQPGTVDTSFADQGIFRYTNAGWTSDVQAIFAQADGSWLAAGKQQSGFGAFWLMLAGQADGRPDSSFGVVHPPSGPTSGSPGVVLTDFPEASFENVNAAAWLSDGRAYVGGGGFFSAISTSQGILARYRADGLLDSSFSDDGYVVGDWLGFIGITKILTQPEGKLWVGFGVNLARADSQGTLDIDWGNQGRAPVSAEDFAVDDHGNLYAVSQDGNSEEVLNLYKLTPNGQLDPSFGANGLITTIVAEFPVSPTLALTPQGKVLIVTEQHANLGFNNELLLLQFNADGTPDPSFGDHGRLNPLPGASFQLQDVLMQPDGHFLAGGALFENGIQDIIVAKFNPDGSLDSTFGVDGLFRAGLATTPQEWSYCYSLALLPDSSLLVSGSAREQGISSAVVIKVQNSIDTLVHGGSPTGLSDLGLSWSVFPHPVQDEVQVRWTDAEWQTLRLLDAQGRLVMTHSVAPGQTLLRWSLGHLPAGLYLLQGQSRSGRQLAQPLWRR